MTILHHSYHISAGSQSAHNADSSYTHPVRPRQTPAQTQNMDEAFPARFWYMAPESEAPAYDRPLLHTEYHANGKLPARLRWSGYGLPLPPLRSVPDIRHIPTLLLPSFLFSFLLLPSLPIPGPSASAYWSYAGNAPSGSVPPVLPGQPASMLQTGRPLRRPEAAPGVPAHSSRHI